MEEKENNIFLALGKYKYNPNKGKNIDEKDLNEQENYFTEAFKILLDRNRELAKEFIKYIDKNNNLKNYDIKELESQSYIGGKKPDIRIKLNDKTLIFVENKIQSKEGNEQIKDYLKNGYVVYITLNEEKIDSNLKNNTNFLGHYRWYQIYDVIQKYQENNQKDNSNNNLINEFLEFMEELKMTPIDISGINMFNKEVLVTYDNLLELKKEIIERLKKEKLEYPIYKRAREDFQWAYEVEEDYNSIWFNLEIEWIEGLKINPKSNYDAAYYSIGFDIKEKRALVSITFCYDEIGQETMEKIKNKLNDKKNVTDNFEIIDKPSDNYIEQRFYMMFSDIFNIKNNENSQQDIIVNFVIESIKKISGSGVLDYLKQNAKNPNLNKHLNENRIIEKRLK